MHSSQSVGVEVMVSCRQGPRPAAEAAMDSIDRMVRYRLMIAGSYHITRLLGRCFSEAIPLVYVCGFPKSGTTWVTQMTADYLQLPFPRLSLLPIGFAAVVHGHETVARHYRRALYVIRDGRDAMVSFYFHLSKNIPSGDNPPLTAKQKKFFPGLINKNDIVRNLPLFIEQQMKFPHGSCGLNWGQHVQRYLDLQRPDVPMVRYEDLLADPVPALSAAMAVFDQTKVDMQRIEATVNKFSFESQTGRRAGKENRQSFLRSGQSGDWKNYFSLEALDVFLH